MPEFFEKSKSFGFFLVSEIPVLRLGLSAGGGVWFDRSKNGAEK